MKYLLGDLEQKVSPHDVEALEEAEESIEEVVGREGSREFDGVEYCWFENPTRIDDTPASLC